jgi:16S rRNA (uracil1498-N3)-methyltransferase
MQLFYQPKLLVNTTQILNEEESRHCAQVLRLKSGDIINITNGNGSFFTAELIDVNHKKCVIAITQETTYPKENNYSLHLAIAPTKSMDRMEWFIEKAVEMGIDEITPLICARSERKEIKTERLMKVAISAMKQSLKYYLPKINEAISFNDFLAKPNLQQPFICFGEAPTTSNLHEFNTSKNHNLFWLAPKVTLHQKKLQQQAKKGISH